MAPHVLGHGVVVDVEREGELGVGLQRRGRHQDHAAGVHLPGGYGTAGSSGTLHPIDGDRGGSEGSPAGPTHPPRPPAAPSALRGSPGASRPPPPSSSAPARGTGMAPACRAAPHPGATAMGKLVAWMRARQHCTRTAHTHTRSWQHCAHPRPVTCFILSFSSSARRRASSFLCKQGHGAERDTQRHGTPWGAITHQDEDLGGLRLGW